MHHLWVPALSIVGAAGLSMALTAPAPFYGRTDLLSDGSVEAPDVNPSLVKPWGLAASASGPFWIANEGTGTSSSALDDGSMFAPDVAVPSDQSGHPTGLVFHGGEGFVVAEGGVEAPARFLFVTLEGRILGWSPEVRTEAAIVAVDERGTGAAYTGLAIAESEGEALLYVANFGRGTVDVLDAEFRPVESFTVPEPRAGYAPFGIATIDGHVWVTYARRDAATGLTVPGDGEGFVAVFTPEGDLVEIAISRGELDAPWALVVAPGGFGRFSHKLLVGNSGDGRILAYNLHTGAFLGALEGEDGEPIAIEGLGGLMFGNGGQAGDPRDLYFTAGAGGEEHGLFGEIELSR